ncbi:HepT-like ribonuclease domain-containing protein [Aliarcobacter butzleri]|uniref:HepT-like ribonuclease domain-containing protein n=1 Tax=Aliarcobacter butzleri TaxID=28197 RepID=UPI0037094541
MIKNVHYKHLFLWLKKYDVINDDDLNNWKKIVLFRNELAHDMLKFLTQIPESDLLDLF